jgi:hypothetical protein
VSVGSGFRRTTAALQCTSGDGRGLLGLGFTSQSSWWPRPHSPAIPCAESTTTSSDTQLGRRARKTAALRRRGRGEVEEVARARGRLGPSPFIGAGREEGRGAHTKKEATALPCPAWAQESVALAAGLGWALAAWPLGWSGSGLRARPGPKG